MIKIKSDAWHLPFIIALFAALGLMVIVPDACRASGDMLKVCIEEGTAAGTLSSSASLRLTDAHGRKVAVGKSVTIQCRRGTILVGGKDLTLPVICRSSSLVKWQGKPYRGEIRIQAGPGAGKLAIVNVIPVEDYLRGVLKMEINPSWPLEAVKAQAIVARTYALAHRGRDAAKGYDFDNTNRSQVYRGVNAEDSRTDRAIAETSGLVVTWEGRLALTPYHADSGGWTADVRDVWGGERPYLVGVREPFPSNSPYSNWTMTLSPAQVSQALSKAGVNIGKVSSLEVSHRDAGGRAVTLKATGSAGSAEIRANAFRMAIGSRSLKSTFFRFGASGVPTSASASSVSAAVPSPDLNGLDGDSLMLELTKQGVFSPEEMMDMLLHPEKRDQYLLQALTRGKGTKGPAPVRKQVPASGERAVLGGAPLVVLGQGWGHGVGMSQWGARAMAQNGWKVRDILGHYYPGTDLARMY